MSSDLPESHRQIERILESITDAFVAVDRQWRYTYVNDRALRRMRSRKGKPLRRENVLGRGMWELFPDVVDTEIHRGYEKAMRERRVVELETYFAPTGEWIEAHAYPSETGLAIYYRNVDDRHRAEAERREAQRRIEAILESVTDPFYALDRGWRLTYVNARAVELLAELRGERLTAEQLVGRDIWELLPALVGTTAHEVYHRAVREQETIAFEYPYPDGRSWFDAHCYPSPDGLSVHFRDVTRRKEEERQLTYHAHLLENLQDAVMATDERFVLRAWNKAAERMFGWSAAEALGRQVSDVVRSEYDDVELAGAFRDMQDTGRRQTETVRYARDGTPVYAEATTIALRDEGGTTTGYLSIMRDVAERRRAEEERARRASQQAIIADLRQRALATYDDVQALMNEAVALVARTLDVDLVEIVELLPDEPDLLLCAGVGWRPGVVGQATEPAAAGSQSGYALERGEPVVAEDLAAEHRFTASPVVRDHDAVSAVTVVIARHRGPFGALGALSTRPRAFSDSDVDFLQAVAGVLGTAIERAEAEARLREVKETERRRIARDLHDEALADLSHAVAEASLAEAAAGGPRATERLAKVVPALKRVGEQLRGAIYDLRLGQEEDRPFRALLEDLVAVHRARDADREINLVLGEGLPAGPLGATGTEVLRILGEALANARRHSGARRIRVDAWGSAGRLCATVSDDGRGFDPGAPPGPGNGIGLEAMRERADLLDADLAVRTRPGAGTEVRLEVRLPGATDAPVQPIRVLLVEDHASVREAIAAALEREPDVQVTGQAASLAEARTMLAGVDVAIVDLGLPDGDGGDLIRELLDLDPGAQALVLSASLDRAEIARAIEQGAAGVLDKTVHLDEVAQAVRRLRAGETLVSVDEVIELVRYADRRRDRQSAERQAIEQLTGRERQVLQALADGLDSRAVADRLQISLRTERNHVAKILAKLDVHSQLQALLFALRHHVVELREP